MSKRKATDAEVMAFIEAVYPDGPDLAAAFFDEATCLRDATRLIRSAEKARAERAKVLREVRDVWDMEADDRIFEAWLDEQLAAEPAAATSVEKVGEEPAHDP